MRSASMQLYRTSSSVFFPLAQCFTNIHPELAGVNSKLCDGFPIDESRRWALFIVETVAGSLSVAAILLRTYSRYAITRHMGGDDWTMLVAGILMIGIMTAGYIGA